MSRLFLLLAAALFLSGCETVKPLYYWGNYEPTMYGALTKPEKFSPELIAQKLEEDLAKAAAKNLQPNPGLHAQLGLAYYQMGRADAAISELEMEKRAFPESSAFIDRMLAQIRGKGAK